MKEVHYVLRENAPVARDVYRMRLGGDASGVTAPGQFLHIRVPGFFLPRPISVCDWSDDEITVLYKTVGDGTAFLSRLREGDYLTALCALGNGFDASVPAKHPLLVGGGVGVPPLYGLAKALVKRGVTPEVCIGAASAGDVLLAEDFARMSCVVHVATADGSAGQKGFVTDAIRRMGAPVDYVFACGPEPMLRAVYDACPCDGQFSFEERMACGIGACMGCSCRTKYGAKRICKDGPVLRREEIIW